MKAVIPSLTIIIFSLLVSCRDAGHEEKTMPEKPAPDEQKLKEQFVQANRQLIERERDVMDYYERSHKLSFTATPSGIRYYVYKHSAAGDSIKPGMQVSMDYKVSLLDGTLCYSSETDGKKTFVVEEDQIESGIHRGLQYLKKGDKALIMIPSALAHGLLGDFDKIPPQMPIVYDVKIDGN